MRRAAAILAVLAVGLLGAACGRGASPSPVAVQVGDLAVPDGITMAEERGVGWRLASAGDDALIGAARLWRLERGGRVVGALQVATWRSGVDGEDRDARSTLLVAVHTGRPAEQVVAGFTVSLSAEAAAPGGARPGLTRASWFTPAGFAVLTLRQDLDPQPVLAAAVAATRQVDP